MNEKEDNSNSNDQEPTVLEHHDPKIEERKPPNAKIIFFKIVKEEKTS